MSPMIYDILRTVFLAATCARPEIRRSALQANPK